MNLFPCGVALGLRFSEALANVSDQRIELFMPEDLMYEL